MRVTSTRWHRFLSRIFGKKSTSSDGSTKIIFHRWGGKTYITRVEFFEK